MRSGNILIFGTIVPSKTIGITNLFLQRHSKIMSILLVLHFLFLHIELVNEYFTIRFYAIQLSILYTYIALQKG